MHIPQHNYVVGEQAFMQSLLVPVIGAGKQDLLQVLQAVFAQIKQKANMQTAGVATCLLQLSPSVPPCR